MRRTSRWLTASAAVLAALGLAATAGEAHKPITSPFTFSEDVFPIVQERCAACHQPGGVAPMSLLTHAEAVPWGESMRAELMAGHMPPWGLDSAPGRFRNVQGLTARELNVLLTWASGGTPAGDPDTPPAAAARERTWPLGSPDAVLPLPEVTLAADAQEHVAQFTIASEFDTPRWIRAVDLLPGTPAIVRSATVSLQSAVATGSGAKPAAEQVLALWLPGDHPVPLDRGMAFHVPAGAEITVRIRYRKTWEYERQVLTDRTQVGLYFADEPAAALRAIDIPAGAPPVVLGDAVHAVAIYASDASGAGVVQVSAERPDGSREELIAFRPRAEWARRYWFRTPVALPRGTRLEVRVDSPDDLLLPPGAVPPPRLAITPAVRVRLDVVPDS